MAEVAEIVEEALLLLQQISGTILCKDPWETQKRDKHLAEKNTLG